jgi:hypothetical protein
MILGHLEQNQIMLSLIFVKTTSLNELDYNSRGHYNLILFMPCRKKMHSTSFFFLATFGLIFLNIKHTS